MANDNVTIPQSDPPEVKRERIRAEAFTDVVSICAILLGLKWGLIPQDYVLHAWGVIAAIGGVGTLMKARGRSGSASVAIATALPKGLAKFGAAIGLGGGHMMAALLAVLVLVQPACGLFSDSGPVLVQCATAPLPALLADVVNILLDGSGPLLNATQLAELEQLGIKYGADAVECAVKQAIGDLMSRGTRARPGDRDAAARGQDYLRRQQP